jgi:hypothetical protein
MSNRNHPPATPNAFGLASSHDMLMKLEREIGRLTSKRPLDRLDAIDYGLNIAITAWHLVDWVWAADIAHSAERRAKAAAMAGVQFNKFDQNAFKNYVLSACPDTRYCQIIATSVKHLRYDPQPKDPKFETAAAPAMITWLNNQGQPVYFTNRAGQRITWNSSATDLWIIEGDTQRRATQVFESVLGWWTQFIG